MYNIDIWNNEGLRISEDRENGHIAVFRASRGQYKEFIEYDFDMIDGKAIVEAIFLCGDDLEKKFFSRVWFASQRVRTFNDRTRFVARDGAYLERFIEEPVRLMSAEAYNALTTGNLEVSKEALEEISYLSDCSWIRRDLEEARRQFEKCRAILLPDGTFLEEHDHKVIIKTKKNGFHCHERISPQLFWMLLTRVGVWVRDELKAR